MSLNCDNKQKFVPKNFGQIYKFRWTVDEHNLQCRKANKQSINIDVYGMDLPSETEEC